jgi:hypothetical protein
MKTKLTLTVEKDVIERAKNYANQTDRSLSNLIEEYLNAITQKNLVEETEPFYGLENKVTKEHYIIPEWLKDIAGCIDADIDYVRDRDKIREERYKKYL